MSVIQSSVSLIYVTLILIQMVTNSFSVTDEQQKVIGSTLYLAGSIFDHSCRPNAVVTFQGTKLTVRAVEDMQDFCWDKVATYGYFGQVAADGTSNR